eukprot:GFUD01036454.1.p1 GENE.GFUD01036454.1~~GFUD01036454.1.p1  ORF type:complete len:609 (+),score=101.36 GFUD01036454.1:134-1960(+)
MVTIKENLEENKKMESEDERESWGSRVSFLLACIGYAVGLGNIWRFPYNAYKSGGGAFLVPYFIMLLFCGIPLLFMELAVGQYTRRGPIGALDKLCPILKGAGVGTVVISFLLSTYYNVILSWALFYLISSFQDPLPWVGCNNWWNSEFCFKNSENISGISKMFNQSMGISSTQEFFDQRVLKMSDGIHDMGEFRLELFGLLALAWVIVYFCLWKGVAMTGKVVYLTATLPIFLLIAFAIRGATLPGAGEGLRFFFTPNWQKVLEPQVWVMAASQVFNSVGIAFGSLIAFSSYNKFRGPVLRDTLIVTLVDAGVSLLCGVAVFAVLGNLAHEQGKNVEDVVADGPGLVFVVFPHALSQMPYPQVWSVVFFGLVICLGIDSQFATVEVIITSIKDGCANLNKYLKHEVLVFIVCFASFLCGIPHVFQGGIYWFHILDYYSATISLMYVAFFETVAIVWCYGAKRLANNVADMTGKEPSIFFTLSWQISAPCLIGIIWAFTLIDYRTPSYNKGQYIYPEWCHVLGWGVTSLSLAALPVVAVVEITKTKAGTSLWEKFQHSWKSKINHCPCCGTKLDESKRAHSSSQLSAISSDEGSEQCFLHPSKDDQDV